ncbi:MAG: ATP-binding protein [Bacteroidales bacterium]|nr:ATP-binding protein [Bacteroidales bacterium]MBR5650685.1 ATP-binding protein [Bacteroidales bacterium]MBR5719927.1 ATP-binding protein [Bacteroidales bacterium]
MKRTLYNQLVEWKNKSTRKPLILEGARQVGKTWLMKEFGKKEFENMVYVNCADEEFAKSLFLHNLKPDRIVRDVVANTRQRIEAGKTLLVFDEIQDAPNGITSLKYFCENVPDLHVMAAGSLLGVVHHPGESYPVGKVDILRLYPMSFEEFLWAKGYDKLAEVLDECEWESITTLGDTLEDLLRQYFFVGGMPEVVLDWVTKEDVLNIREIQNRIIASYSNDVSKHAGTETERIRMVWNSIPAQLAKENKKFIYGAVKKGGRAKEFEVAIQWLVDAGLVHKIYRSKTPEMPLKMYEDFNAFKLFLLDVGLLGALAGTGPAQIIANNEVFKEFKGAFTENYVLQQLVPEHLLHIGYFSKENSQVEIDFLVQTHSRIIPIEVKAEENVKSKSLRQFITIDQSDKKLKGLRCSMKPYIDQGWMENIPLFGVMNYFRQQIKNETTELF